MPLTEAELEPLLRLAMVQGVGPQRLAALVERFGSAEGVVAAPTTRLRGVRGIGGELAARVQAADGRRARVATAAAMETMRRIDAFALTPEDPAYPTSFNHLPDPPYLLYGAGDVGALQLPAIAVVGTRSPTTYGCTTAERLSWELALAGYAIISGLARGVDSAAHRGALQASGSPIGVLGHGIEQIYPPENRGLFESVRRSGLLLTEYPPGETPKAGNFPRRNRLIAALSQAVLVVEMGQRSGAQHTVTYALEQGKEVMAVPGSIASPASTGTNQLIKDGARLVVSAADVIEELRGVGASNGMRAVVRDPSPSRPPSASAPVLPLLTGAEEGVLRSLSFEPQHVDQLLSGAGVTIASTLTALLHLELRGLVTSLPGKRYCRR